MIPHQSKNPTPNSRLSPGAQPIALAFGQQNAILEKFRPAETDLVDRTFDVQKVAAHNNPGTTVSNRDHLNQRGALSQDLRIAGHEVAGLSQHNATPSRIRSKSTPATMESTAELTTESLAGPILTTVDPSVPAAEAQAAARFFIENQKSELEKLNAGTSPSERNMSNLNSSDHLFVANLQAVSLEKLVKSKLEVLFQQQRDANIELSGLYDIVLEQVEKPLIELALQSRNGNQVKTAQLLGINRNTLKKKIDGYKIKVRRSSQKDD